MDHTIESKRLELVEPDNLAEYSQKRGKEVAQAPGKRGATLLRDGLEMTPMYDEDNRANFSDRFLGQVFRRIVREDILNRLFYDGSVRNTRDFRHFAHNRDNELFFVSIDDNPVGFFWLNRFRHKSFFINYCFYREFRGNDAERISNICIDHIFAHRDHSGDFMVDALLGLTPADNKLAVRFLLKNGMTVLGRVPGFIYDAIRDKSVDGIFSYRQRNRQTGFRISSLFFS